MASVVVSTAFQTELGWMAVSWRDHELTRVTFGHASISAAQQALGLAACPDTLWDADRQELVDRLRSFAEGHPEDFADVRVSLDGRTPFQRDVLGACRQIPFGATCSYSELAERAGYPRAARAVGNVMAQNRTPLVIPCHRVIACGTGRWGGFGAIGGVRTKRRLLQLERDACIVAG
jgi:methylated-DNA-[protein]-cysteine S-methyltransferase